MIDASAQARVRRFGMVSYFRAGQITLWRKMIRSSRTRRPRQLENREDAHLRASDLDWTVLGPGRLTLDPPTGRIAVGEGKGQVSRADVALVVAAALADDSTIGRTIDFNNGELAIADALAR